VHVQCTLYMHKDMFEKVNNFRSISMCIKNMYMDKFLKISKSTSMWMRVKRLDEGGIVLWASQS